MIPLRPLSVGEILDGAFSSIRSNPKATLGLAAAVLAVSAVVTSGLLLIIGRLIGQVALPAGGGPAAAAEAARRAIGLFGVALPLGALSVLLSFVAGVILTGLLTVVIGRGVLGGAVAAGDAWRLGRSRLPALLGAIASIVLATAGPWVAFALLVVVLAVAGAPGWVIGVFAFAGALSALCATVWFSVMFKAAVPAVVLEGAGPAAALARSWRLLRGSFWRVFGIMLLTRIVVSVAGGILQIPFLIAAAVAGGGPPFGGMFGGSGALTVAAGGSILSVAISAIGGVVAGTVTKPVSAGVTVLLYVDLRMRREGLDLVLQQAAAGPAGMRDGDLWRPPAASWTAAGSPTGASPALRNWPNPSGPVPGGPVPGGPVPGGPVPGGPVPGGPVPGGPVPGGPVPGGPVPGGPVPGGPVPGGPERPEPGSPPTW